MNKLLSFFIIAAMLFTACENDTTGSGGGGEDTTPKLNLTSKSDVEVSGQKTTGMITYTIENPSDELTVEAVSSVDWLYNFDHNKVGSIIYMVAENGTDQPRNGTITVTYGPASFTVNVTQLGNDNPSQITLEAPMLVGQYFGTYTQGYYNYWLAFSDKGLSSYEPALGVTYDHVPNAYYYIADVYTNKAPEDENLRLPDGTYKLGRGEMHCISADLSWLQFNDESGFPLKQFEYESAVLVVEDGKLTFTVEVLRNSQLETHTVTYSGDYSLIDMTTVYGG